MHLAECDKLDSDTYETQNKYTQQVLKKGLLAPFLLVWQRFAKLD